MQTRQVVEGRAVVAVALEVRWLGRKIRRRDELYAYEEMVTKHRQAPGPIAMQTDGSTGRAKAERWEAADDRNVAG